MWTRSFNLTGRERFAAGRFLARVDANRTLAPSTLESGSRSEQVWTRPKTVNAIAVTNEQLTTALANKEAECSTLANDNKTLSTKVATLTTKLSKRSWEFYTAKPTLLIGYSIIRNVDENKPDNTIVRSMSGATIGDVHDELSIDDKLYKKIFVCAGTNDCRKSDMDIEVVTENFSTLLRWHRLKWQPPMTWSLAAFLHAPIAQERNNV